MCIRDRLKARQVARLKAHYVMQNRLAMELQADPTEYIEQGLRIPQFADSGLERAEKSELLTERALSCTRQEFGSLMLAAAAKKKFQEFGIVKLLGAGGWVDDLHPVHQLPKLPHREFLENEGAVTLVTFAALLGQWKVCMALIKGGADPTVRPCAPDGRPMVKAFLRQLPASYAMWVLSTVVKARSNFLGQAETEVRCGKCDSLAEGPVVWGAPCNHVMCEQCLWADFLQENHRPELLCPICLASVPGAPPSQPLLPLDKSTSLWAWSQLPEQATQDDLVRDKKQGRRKFELCHNLYEAHRSSLGLTKGTRQELLDGALGRGDVARCRVLMEAGVNVDWVNEYGQTGLYVAAWRGMAAMVQLFLQAGADPTIRASCGTSPLEVAVLHNHEPVIQLLLESGVESEQVSDFNGGRCGKIGAHGSTSDESSHQVTRHQLIGAEAEHPGAGSVWIDGLGQPGIEHLISIWQKLPTAPGRVTASCSSRRSYFCDVRGEVCAALRSLVKCSGSGDCVVLPWMRFLDYSLPGAWLAPHIDLSRQDHDGRRSTHTFLLYLTSVKTGGQTALLEAVNQELSDKVLGVVQPRAGRLLVFPHVCPHEGRQVVDVPKLVVRGELYFIE
eukprot:TRINITY_DN28657_c0_g1_i1.p1 TRINITY_DN28657_c0_g1~~TRINITY_DN28657_c0_g1_i1.p1  ORF type:complete len:617 (+),score=93.29 TRINITY_DN28657_c0_g1_i1:152-2002(+)